MSGEHFRDQVSYTADGVRAVLPAVWDETFILSARPPRAEGSGLRSKVDPRHVPDWLLGCADVQRAFNRSGLTLAERECLRNVYHLGFTPGELAMAWVDVTSEEVHHACETGIQKLSDYLSGRTPA